MQFKVGDEVTIRDDFPCNCDVCNQLRGSEKVTITDISGDYVYITNKEGTLLQEFQPCDLILVNNIQSKISEKYAI